MPPRRTSAPAAERAAGWGTRREATGRSQAAGRARFLREGGEAVPRHELAPGTCESAHRPELGVQTRPQRIPTSERVPSPPGGPWKAASPGGARVRGPAVRRPGPPAPSAGQAGRAPPEGGSPQSAADAAPTSPAAPDRVSRLAPSRCQGALPSPVAARRPRRSRGSPWALPLDPSGARGGGGRSSLTVQRLRAAPGPRGAPGIFFWETSPWSAGLSRPGRKSAQRQEAATIRELPRDVNPPPRLPVAPPPHPTPPLRARHMRTRHEAAAGLWPSSQGATPAQLGSEAQRPGASGPPQRSVVGAVG